MRKVCVLTLLAVALTAASVSATTVAYVPVKKAFQLSDVVLVGHVLGIEAEYNASGEIVTKINLLVEENLKGWVNAGEVFSFHAYGGSLDGVNVETVGEAKYRLGQKVLVQLEDIDGEFHTLGLSFGKWDVIRGNDGRSWAVRSLDDLNMLGVDESPVTRIPLDRMRTVARERHSF